MDRLGVSSVAEERGIEGLADSAEGTASGQDSWRNTEQVCHVRICYKSIVLVTYRDHSANLEVAAGGYAR
jgi:hypothetical protein